MRKLNQDELTLVVSLYRSLKSNPKDFKLADTSRKALMEIIDVKYFDIGKSYGHHIQYAGFSTGHFLGQRLAGSYRGEEFRNIEKSINNVLAQLTKSTLRALRSGDIPDEALTVAAYIHLGAAHDILPRLNDRNYHSGDWYALEDEGKMPDAQAN